MVDVKLTLVAVRVAYTMKTDPTKQVVAIQIPSMGLAFKLWQAALLLCEYLEDNAQPLKLQGSSYARSLLLLRLLSSNLNSRSVVELGAGTGIVALLAAQLGAKEAILTDIESVVGNMQANIDANTVPAGCTAAAKSLDWIQVSEAFEEAGGLGKSGGRKPSKEESYQAALKALPEFCQPGKVDLILASDVVYLEPLFEPLVNTMVALTAIAPNQDPNTPPKEPPIILMAYERRRKLENRFYKRASKYFEVTNVKGIVDTKARHGHIDVIQFKRKPEQSK